MKKLFIFIFFSLFHLATTYVIKEGDVEVGRWTENDGVDAVHEIQEDKRSGSAAGASASPPGKKQTSFIDSPRRFNDWYQDGRGYQEAVLKQKEFKTPIFLYFQTTWCGVCKKFNKNTLPKPAVQDHLKKFPHVMIDADKEKTLAKKYNVNGYPTFFVQLPGGKINEVERFSDPQDFLEGLKKAGLVAPK